MSHSTVLALIGGDEEVATFQVGDLSLGIDINCIQEINSEIDVFPVPNAPAEIHGVINLRGDVVTVIDLGIVFWRTRTTAGASSRLVIVEDGAERIAFLADEIEDIRTVDPNAVEPAPANVGGAEGRFFRCIFKREGKLTAILDVAETLKALEGES